MFIKFSEDFAKTQVIRLHPVRAFVSSSTGPTGSIKVVVNRSQTMKDNIDDRVGLTGVDAPQTFDENTFEGRRKLIFGGENTPVGDGTVWADWVPRQARTAVVTGSVPTLNFASNFEGKTLDIGIAGMYEVDDPNGGRVLQHQHFTASLMFTGGESNMTEIADRLNSLLAGEAVATFQTINDQDTLSIATVQTGLSASISVSGSHDHLTFGAALGYGSGSEGSHAVGVNAEDDIPAEAAYNYELQLALLLDGAAVEQNTGYLGDLDNHANPMPPEFFKKEYTQLNLNEAHSGYSDLDMHPRNNAQVEIKREIPGSDLFSSGSMIKELVRKNLSIDYQYQLGGRWDYGCTNFNCVNLFKVFSNPNPAIVYPAMGNQYTPTSSFGLEFWLKMPRRPVNAGTVVHLPKGFALSVVTGSGKALDGLPSAYRLLLQLDDEAYGGAFAPEHINLSTITSDAPTTASSHIFISSASITPDTWHHCMIRWSSLVNNGTGSFFINKQNAGDFNLRDNFEFNTTASAVQVPALFVGGYWPGTQLQARGFFNVTGSAKQGVVRKYGSNEANSSDVKVLLSGGLDAEIHELRIWDRDISQHHIGKYYAKSLVGNEDGLMFYTPYFFDAVLTSSLSSSIPANWYEAMVGDLTDATDSNSYYASASQFYEEEPMLVSASFGYPFNTHYANIGGFLNMNVQAYLREYVQGRYPYMHLLSDSLGGDIRNGDALLETGFGTASCHIYSSSWENSIPHQRRNLLMLPCDNGLFEPDYSIMSTEADHDLNQYGTFEGKPDYSWLQLESLGDLSTNFDSKLTMADEGFKYMGAFLEKAGNDIGQTAQEVLVSHLVDADGNPVDSITGTLMDLPNVVYFDAQNYADKTETSSNMVTVFSVPILYYGNKIKPRSLSIECQNMLFSENTQGDCNVILKDDGLGGLYRANCSGSIATKTRVGDVYYNDGVVIIKNPALHSFGKYDYTFNFEGDQNLYVYELNIPCTPDLLNSSSNPNYQELEANNNANDDATKFVYISGINIHDDNLNVVAKARFAQPLVKKPGEKFLFRLRMDY